LKKPPKPRNDIDDHQSEEGSVDDGEQGGPESTSTTMPPADLVIDTATIRSDGPTSPIMLSPVKVFIEKASHCSSKRQGTKTSQFVSEVWRSISIPQVTLQLETTSVLMTTMASFLERIVRHVSKEIIIDMLQCYLAVYGFSVVVLSNGSRIVDIESQSPAILDGLLKIQKEAISNYVTFTAKFFGKCSLSIVLPSADMQSPDPALSENAGQLLFSTCGILLRRFLLVHHVMHHPQEYEHMLNAERVIGSCSDLIQNPTSDISKASIASDMWSRQYHNIAPVVCTVVDAIGALEADEFALWIPQFFDMMCQLLDLSDAFISRSVTKVIRRIGRDQLGWKIITPDS
jgi:hypothetical protein